MNFKKKNLYGRSLTATKQYSCQTTIALRNNQLYKNSHIQVEKHLAVDNESKGSSLSPVKLAFKGISVHKFIILKILL